MAQIENKPGSKTPVQNGELTETFFDTENLDNNGNPKLSFKNKDGVFEIGAGGGGGLFLKKTEQIIVTSEQIINNGLTGIPIFSFPEDKVCYISEIIISSVNGGEPFLGDSPIINFKNIFDHFLFQSNEINLNGFGEPGVVRCYKTNKNIRLSLGDQIKLFTYASLSDGNFEIAITIIYLSN